MLHRRMVLAIFIGFLVLGCAAPAFGGSLTVYRLEPSSEWVELPPVNPYATAVRGNPLQGWGCAGTVSLPVRATATFEPDMRRAEITVDFIPVSRDIRPNDARLFIAPLGRRLEWRVAITVRNPNDIAMRQVKVRDEFGPAFRATLAGRPQGDARIEGDDPRGRLLLNPTLVWDIGDLAPSEAARAEVTVVTGRDGHGSQHFTREGIYSIDTGARLTYVLAGQSQIRNAPPGSVIARKDADALRGDGAPFDVPASPIAGEGSPGPGSGPAVPSVSPIVSKGPQVGVVMRRVNEEGGIGARGISRQGGRFDLAAAATTPNVTEVGTGIDQRFVVPPGEYAEWEVSIAITNLAELGWSEWTMAITFGAELSVEEVPGTRDIVPPFPWWPFDPGTGDPLDIIRDPTTAKVDVRWGWSGDFLCFIQGTRAVVKLKVYTTSPTGYAPSELDYIFSHFMMLHFLPYNGIPATIRLDAIYIRSESEAHADIALSATRLDWRVRKPGTYASIATEMTFAGTGNLSVQFDDFADLARQDGGAAIIATWYGFGQDLGAVESSGWIVADDLNLDSNSRGPIALDPTTPTTLRMWSKIAVGEEDSSCEYEDVGVITFIVSNGGP